MSNEIFPPEKELIVYSSVFPDTECMPTSRADKEVTEAFNHFNFLYFLWKLDFAWENGDEQCHLSTSFLHLIVGKRMIYT